jgi:uncharacterized protein YjbI with pentapeptide repeats
MNPQHDSEQTNQPIEGVIPPAQIGTESTIVAPEQPTPIPVSPVSFVVASDRGSSTSPGLSSTQPSALVVLCLAIPITIVGIVLNNDWLTLAGAAVSLLVSLRLVVPWLGSALQQLLADAQNIPLFAILGITVAIVGALQLSGNLKHLRHWFTQPNWDAIGALGEVFGALGQILIALLAVWIAWRQYVIEKELTTRQNIITQQQTIDTYFQGISDLVIDEEGLLEDWPQERAIAEGRTAALLSSVDGAGKAKILRFLSHSGLLTPLKRDSRLGRAILDGTGGYAEDRNRGVRVISLGVMLARADLSSTDLRWTDLSDANLISAHLGECDLVKANLARSILCKANLRGADLEGTRLFYGDVKTATPRSRTGRPNYETGEYTGAVVEDADFTNVKELSEEQRYYCCAWGGTKTRATLPGGCAGIPNKLGC